MTSSRAEEGFQHLAQGDAEAAVASFEAALATDAGDQHAMLGLARVRLLEEDRDAARALLEKLVGLAPDHFEAQSHLAFIQFLDGDQDARPTLEKLAARPEATVFEHLNLARVCSLSGEHDAAEEAFAKAIALEPENVLLHFEAGESALELGDSAGAVAHLEDAVRLAPDELLPALLLVRAYRIDERIDEAANALLPLLEDAPEEPLVLEEAFAVALDAGEPEKAVGLAERLLQLEPEVADHRRLLGLALFEAGEVVKARETLTKLVEEVPELIEARHALADVLEAEGNLDGARAVLEKLVEEDPASPGPANDLALLYFAQPDGMPRAEAILRRVLEDWPDDAITHFNLALCLGVKSPSEALVHAKKSLEADEPEVTEQAERLIANLTKQLS